MDRENQNQAVIEQQRQNLMKYIEVSGGDRIMCLESWGVISRVWIRETMFDWNSMSVFSCLVSGSEIMCSNGVVYSESG